MGQAKLRKSDSGSKISMCAIISEKNQGVNRMIDDWSKKKKQFIRESKMFDVYGVKIGDVIPNKDYRNIYKEYKKEINHDRRAKKYK